VPKNWEKQRVSGVGTFGCTVRGSPSLADSPTRETTYVPSDGCFQATLQDSDDSDVSFTVGIVVGSSVILVLLLVILYLAARLRRLQKLAEVAQQGNQPGAVAMGNISFDPDGGPLNPGGVTPALDTTQIVVGTPVDSSAHKG